MKDGVSEWVIIESFIKLMIKKMLSVFIELNIGGKLIASLASNISGCLLLLR